MNAHGAQKSFWEAGFPPCSPKHVTLPEKSSHEDIIRAYDVELRQCRMHGQLLANMVWARDHQFNQLAGFLKEKAPDLFKEYFQPQRKKEQKKSPPRPKARNVYAG